MCAQACCGGNYYVHSVDTLFDIVLTAELCGCYLCSMHMPGSERSESVVPVTPAGDVWLPCIVCPGELATGIHLPPCNAAGML